MGELRGVTREYRTTVVIAGLLLAAFAYVPAIAQGQTVTTVNAKVGVPFTTPPVTGETVAGTSVTVTFTAISSATGTVTATAGVAARNPVFSIVAPTGGRISVIKIGVNGLPVPALMDIDVKDTSGATVETCETTTVSFAVGVNGLLFVPPPCQVPSATVTVVTGFPSTMPTSHDSRYFPQTGFRIDNDTIWDYFNRRGGVNTFGYPVSRTFLFQGFPVQFFQRRIVQLGPDGHARLLNVLDPGLLPYTSFNFATVPAFDPALVATAPDPTNASAVLAWVQAHAPDSFQGLPVHFSQTFLNTVPAAVAFPNGGDPRLLPGFDLEIWGIPTSPPMVDPHNHNFVYLRFQRGIMMFDARCTCTQGVLLADYLKGILTGQNLPADLDQEAKDSPFYKQYDPGAPHWVHDPSLLPNTDLTNAFSPE